MLSSSPNLTIFPWFECATIVLRMIKITVYKGDVGALCAAIKNSNFEELLEDDGSVSIHHQNIRFLAI